MAPPEISHFAVASDAKQKPADTKASWLARPNKWRSTIPQGWRFGILTGSLLSCLVLLTNIILAAVAATTQQNLDRSDGQRQKAIFQGNCKRAGQLSLALHLVINTLSTLLLGASNYAMQCLSAPTRKDIDAAHIRQKWLDIGILSFRNLGVISRKRLALWLALGLSSLPLHLLYNSAIYSSITARDYAVFTANTSIIGADSSVSAPLVANTSDWFLTSEMLREKASKKQLIQLQPQECIRTYATPFVTRNRHLILVTTKKSETTIDSTPYYYDTIAWTIERTDRSCNPFSFDWICSGRRDLEHRQCYGESTCSNTVNSLDANNWAPFGQKVQYCLTEGVDEMCQLHFSTELAVMVIACNLIKVLVLAFIFLKDSDKPLLTMGDAVASFMAAPDGTTQGMCLMSKADFKEKGNRQRLNHGPFPKSYQVKTIRWFDAVSKSRWWTCMTLLVEGSCILAIGYTLLLTLCLALFCRGVSGASSSSKETISVGFGVTDPRTFISGLNLPKSGIKGFMSNVLLANLPQVILSAIYFTYNGLFTMFALILEWKGYGEHRKGLRVSSAPRGAQKSSYFLQLPYRFAVPLIVMSGILHWLCSQGIFLVNVNVQRAKELQKFAITSPTGFQEFGRYMTCGYSPKAILTVLFVGVFMFAIVIKAGRRRFRTGMPVAGSCSAPISAMCHSHAGWTDVEGPFCPMKWGATTSSASMQFSEVGHCCFSSQSVYEPREGFSYS